MSKSYVHKAESILVKETQNVLWDFEIQKNNLIPARRPDPVLINKKIDLSFSWFADLTEEMKE